MSKSPIMINLLLISHNDVWTARVRKKCSMLLQGRVMFNGESWWKVCIVACIDNLALRIRRRVAT